MDDVRLVTHPQAASNWYITLADIILLLMTFFVMLLSMSTVSDIRTKAAMDSISASFSDSGPRGRHDPFVASDGDVLGAQEFQTRIGEVFQTAIPAARVTLVRPGMLLEAEFEAEALFLPDKAELRPAQRGLLDRLVAAIAVPPPGRRVEVEFSARLATGADGMLPVGETLSVARAGVFAREITGRGLPPQAVGVGIERGVPGKVRVLFRLTHAEDGAAGRD